MHSASFHYDTRARFLLRWTAAEKERSIHDFFMHGSVCCRLISGVLRVFFLCRRLKIIYSVVLLGILVVIQRNREQVHRRLK
jgi:hypothetical protein